MKTKENPSQFQSFTESPHGPVDWAGSALVILMGYGPSVKLLGP